MCPPAAYEGVARSGTPSDERPEPVRIWLLGGFSVAVGSRTIEHNEWHLRKAASLVKLLALAPHHRLHREQVMDRLWPDSGKSSASNNLRQIVHTTRKTLDPVSGSRYLQSDNDSLVLCPEGELWVDVEAFEEAAATARRSKDPAAYRVALDLYAGELLPEDRYEEWAQDRRQGLRGIHLELLTELAQVHEHRGEYGPAVEALRRTVAEDPTNEKAHAGLMRLYALLGRQVEALAQYGRLRELLSREFGTEPGPATRRLHEEIATGTFISAGTSPVGHLPEAPAANGTHNLPAPRSSFVGREREMVEVKRELAMTRLLTLTGAGGSGKTRLALEVVRSLVGAYPAGVWLVELAPISAAELLPQAVAKALEVPERPGQPLTATLIRAMRRKRLLLVLENCEHLLEAAAELVNALLDRLAPRRPGHPPGHGPPPAGTGGEPSRVRNHDGQRRHRSRLHAGRGALTQKTEVASDLDELPEGSLVAVDSVNGWAIAAQVSPDTLKNNLIVTHDSDFRAAVRKPRAHKVTQFLVPDPERYPNDLITDRWAKLYANNQPGFELVKEYPETPEKWHLYEVAPGSEQGKPPQRQQADADRPQQENSGAKKEQAASPDKQSTYVHEVGEIQANSVEAFLDSHEKLLRYDGLTSGDIEKMQANQAVLHGFADQASDRGAPQKYTDQKDAFLAAIQELHQAAQLAYALAADPISATQADFDHYDRLVNEAAAGLQQSNEILGKDFKTIEGVQG